MSKKVDVEEKVLEFYRRIVFGSIYNRKKKPEDENIIVGWCFNCAWKDMASHTLIFQVKGINDKLKNKIKENFKNEFLKIFNNWRSYFVNNSKIREMISDCCKIVEKTEPETKLTYNKYFDFSFGQAQKVVNMFFKYLYTLKDEVKISDDYFDICDCPIDSIILENLYNQKKYNDTVWSKLNDIEYNAIQEDIKEKVKKEKYSNKLDFDFNCWNKKTT